MMIRGTALGAMIAVPAIAVFLAVWQIRDSLFEAAIAGGVAHFVAMGFALRMARGLLGKKGP